MNEQPDDMTDGWPVAVLVELPPDLLPGLDSEDQEAIKAIVGKPVRFEGYQWGKAELVWRADDNTIHTVWVDPFFVRFEG